MKNYLYNLHLANTTLSISFYILLLLALILLFKYRKTLPINGLIDDTLKRWDPVTKKIAWSRTSLTMCTAWFAALSTYLYECYKNGFNEIGFYAMVGVALGSKVTDALSKKMSPTDTTSTPNNP